MKIFKNVSYILLVVLACLCFCVLLACNKAGVDEDSSTLNTTEEEATEENSKAEASPSSFTKASISVGNTDFNFWLYTPQNAEAAMPLIVYLHGGSGKGNDLDILISNDGFPKYIYDGDLGSIGAYVVIPQLNSNKTGWTDVKENIRSLINYMVENFGVDKSNVSLTGHSMGGTGTWGIAVSYPKIFARIAPLSGSIKNTTANISALSAMSVWAFVGSADTIVQPSYSIDFIAELSKTNSNAKCTELEGAGHFDVPSFVYLSDEYNLINWLISGS